MFCSLQPGESSTVNLFIRARHAGLKQQFKFLFCYENDGASKHLPQRMLRRVAVTDVLPCLSVVPFVRPSYMKPVEYVLGLQVCSACDLETVVVRQVTTVGSVWRLEPLIENLYVSLSSPCVSYLVL